ncbi:MAG: hypothetical protein J2P17_25345 [Mycobacterium sp.]|nr:hypothetical protein [Mycobacterium sp.]
MTTTDLRKVGSISLLDLDIISRFYGRDFLPYPFMLTQPSRFSSHAEYIRYAISVPDRFNNGDLHIFQQWAASYAYADIRVECHVQYIPAEPPSVRVAAARRDQKGFLAKQRPAEDVIDVYELCPYLLGPAVADSVALQKPGRHVGIVIPEYVRAPDNPGALDNFIIHNAIDDEPNATEVARTEVTAFGTVQTHWRPARCWGPDPGKKAATWVRINDDGDYLYTADFSEARPMSQPMLAERVDQLITEDIRALRQFRNG